MPRRVLIYCLAGVGDTIMATPAIEGLRRALPNAHLTAITMLGGSNEILKNNPNLDELMHFEFQKHGLWKSINYLYALRKRSFDAAIAT